jgi:catechol 2,3-dioxygenase-like lactoylglutathione lyase family enzyme
MSAQAGVCGLHHAGLTVANLERSIAFYTGQLGLKLIGVWEHAGEGVGLVTGYPGASVRQAFLRIPGADGVLELLEYTGGGAAIDPANGNAGAVHVALVVDDLDAAYARLKAQGCRFVSPPTRTARNPVLHGKVAYLIDPDGIRIELYEPRKVTTSTSR